MKYGGYVLDLYTNATRQARVVDCYMLYKIILYTNATRQARDVDIVYSSQTKERVDSSIQVREKNTQTCFY